MNGAPTPAPGPSPRTYGICSDLAGEAGLAALELWDHLAARYGLREARAAIRPHVSYLVGESDRPAELAAAVAEVGPRLTPPSIVLSGIGVFDGPSPVVYLAVEKNPALVAVHQGVLAATWRAWSRIWPYYLERAWTPHVTLALRDLPREGLADVVRDLRARFAPRSARLDQLALVHVILPTHVYRARIPLGPAGPTRGAARQG